MSQNLKTKPEEEPKNGDSKQKLKGSLRNGLSMLLAWLLLLMQPTHMENTCKGKAELCENGGGKGGRTPTSSSWSSRKMAKPRRCYWQAEEGRMDACLFLPSLLPDAIPAAFPGLFTPHSATSPPFWPLHITCNHHFVLAINTCCLLSAASATHHILPVPLISFTQDIRPALKHAHKHRSGIYNFQSSAHWTHTHTHFIACDIFIACKVHNLSEKKQQKIWSQRKAGKSRRDSKSWGNRVNKHPNPTQKCSKTIH